MFVKSAPGRREGILKVGAEPASRRSPFVLRLSSFVSRGQRSPVGGRRLAAAHVNAERGLERSLQAQRFHKALVELGIQIKLHVPGAAGQRFATRKVAGLQEPGRA